MNDEQRELINAFNDGQLDDLQSESVRKLLARDPQVRAYHERIVALDDLLRASFEPVARQPLPPRLNALLRKHRRPGIARHLVPMGLAAGLLVAAVLIYRQDVMEQQMREQLLRMRQDIAAVRYQALENTPSGEVASWTAPIGSTHAQVVPLKTYRTPSHGFCREYEERIEDADGVEVRRGIACRTGKGHWPDLTKVPAAAGAGPAAQEDAGLRM